MPVRFQGINKVPTHSKVKTNRCTTCEFRSVRMFCKLDEPSIAEFEAIGTEISVSRGTTIFREGAPANAVHVLCSGQIKLFCTSKEGRTLILKLAMPGDVLGLGAVISNLAYEVTAEALEPCQMKTIRREDFLAFLNKHGDASMNAAKSLSEDYKAAFLDARLLGLSDSVAARLAAILLDWGRSSSCGNHDMSFNLALTHEEVASLVGSSRETITRLLARFKREKLISMRGVAVHILAPEKLEQLSA